ncbi:hypothetical protein RHGRI_028188 [Rhododendron griersonianum]|uniref:Peptidase C1A papain C-terminal domain-containing protein n=1 Tax=Rhododendron griersonianum TaxID=479676 RepID=A0AAV6IGZ1_9ERIC|nr:hypothetical protein RHGRI_028188 [Rhododendron griersonianum]
MTGFSAAAAGFGVFMFRRRSGTESRLWLEAKVGRKEMLEKEKMEFSLVIYASAESFPITPLEVVVREYDEERDKAGVEELERRCEIGQRGKPSMAPTSWETLSAGSCSGVASIQCMNFMLMHKEDWPIDTKPSIAELVNEMQKKLPDDCHVQEFEPNSRVPKDGGFRGFNPPAAFKYMQKFGVCLDRYHPYKGRMTKRKVPARSPRIRIGGYTVLKGNGRKAKIKPIIRKHPIVGEFSAYKNFSNHVDGIYRGYKDESEKKTKCGHSVLVFGYGGEGKDSYLDVQNTWKPEEWGKDGIGKISDNLFHRFSFLDAKSISLEQPGASDKAGIVEALDKLVKEFVTASSEEKKTVYNRMKEEVEKLKGSASRYGKIYLKAARRCMIKGADYATNKIQLLEHKLKKSTISAAKADYLTLKKNILSTFVP